MTKQNYYDVEYTSSKYEYEPSVSDALKYKAFKAAKNAIKQPLRSSFNLMQVGFVSLIIYAAVLTNQGVDFKQTPIIANAQTLTSQSLIDGSQDTDSITQTAEIEPLSTVEQPLGSLTPTPEQVKDVIGNNKSPITAERWLELSKELNMPLDFLLVVAFQESHFGTKGRAVETQNIYNVGNTDCGDGKAVAQDECNRFIESWELGVYEFSKLIQNCYFHENETIKIETWINRDFRAVRCNIKGKRYMSDKFSKFKYKASLKTIQEKLSTN